MPPKGKASAAKPAAKKRAPKNTHQLAPRLTKGHTLTDFLKKEWKVGEPIGSGGFGLIYLADQNSSKPVGDNAEYVLKVEPHSNGPLFCELHFYQRAAKPEYIKEWISKKKIKHLGMPKFVAAGACDIQGTKCRFMIMERFGTDLQKTFEQNGKRFPVSTVMSLGSRTLDTLEYIHDRDYCHADIKASNMLMGHGKNADQVYLVDFGLAFKYVTESGHKDYKEDPKRTHDGTIEFTSRDAHKGVCPSRRGDLEILAYCMVQWLCGRLPWEDNLVNKEYVSKQKFRYMADIPGFVRTCFPGGDCPDEMVKFLQYVVKMDYTEKPDYAKCKLFFKKAGGSDSGKISLSMANGGSAKAKNPAKRQKKSKSSDFEEDDLESPDVEIRSPPKQRKTLPSARGRKKRIVSESTDEDSDDSEFEISVPIKQKQVATPKQKSTPKPRKAASSTAAMAVSPAAASPRPHIAAKAKSPAARAKSPRAAKAPRAAPQRTKSAPPKPKSPKDATKQAPKNSPRSSSSKKNASRKTSKALNPKKSITRKKNDSCTKKDSLKTKDTPKKDDSPKKKSLVKKILDKSGLSLTVEAAIASDDAGQFPACSESEEEVKSGVKSAWNAYCTVS